MISTFLDPDAFSAGQDFAAQLAAHPVWGWLSALALAIPVAYRLDGALEKRKRAKQQRQAEQQRRRSGQYRRRDGLPKNIDEAIKRLEERPKPIAKVEVLPPEQSAPKIHPAATRVREKILEQLAVEAEFDKLAKEFPEYEKRIGRMKEKETDRFKEEA